MNRSFMEESSKLKQRRQLLMESLRISTTEKEKEEELGLFLEMRKREKERSDLLLLQNSNEIDAPLGSKSGSSPIFNIVPNASARKTIADDFLNSENDKNDYDWLLTPPGTPLFPSLEMESQTTFMNQMGCPKSRNTTLRSRLADAQPEPVPRSGLVSRQPAASSPGLNGSGTGLRRPSSSGGTGSRPATPTGRSTAKSTLTSTSRSTSTTTSKSTSLTSSRPASLTASKSSSATTASKPSRSATPTSRATVPATRTIVPPRSSTPTRSTTRSSTPTRPSVPATKSTSRAATPTRRPTAVPPERNVSVAPGKSLSSSSISRPTPTTARNPAPPRSSSPTVKPRPWKPSDMPGFSLDAPPNLRTSLPDRPTSAMRGRPGAPSARSSSIEPASNGRVRRQSCSPARGRPNGVSRGSGSSVPALNRLHAKANDNVSPVVVGNKMVERVINMRKLAPPKQDDRHSPLSNLSGKSSSSPDSSGFGRTLSKKSLDMAIRHMDIRRSIPGNLRPLMTRIPASSMYSVRSGPTRSRTMSVSDSPLATSSNASSEFSVNNNALCADGSEVDDDISSDKGIRSPASLRGR